MGSYAGAVCGVRRLFVEAYIAVDPVAHFPPSYSPPPLSTPFDAQHGSTLAASPREAYHLTVVRATRIGTSAWEIKENVNRGNEHRIGEEYLGIGSRLMGKKNDERGPLFVEDRAQGQIDLRKTGGTALTVE